MDPTRSSNFPDNSQYGSAPNEKSKPQKKRKEKAIATQEERNLIYEKASSAKRVYNRIPRIEWERIGKEINAARTIPFSEKALMDYFTQEKKIRWLASFKNPDSPETEHIESTVSPQKRTREQMEENPTPEGYPNFPTLLQFPEITETSEVLEDNSAPVLNPETSSKTQKKSVQTLSEELIDEAIKDYNGVIPMEKWEEIQKIIDLERIKEGPL